MNQPIPIISPYIEWHQCTLMSMYSLFLDVSRLLSLSLLVCVCVCLYVYKQNSQSQFRRRSENEREQYDPSNFTIHFYIRMVSAKVSSVFEHISFWICQIVEFSLIFWNTATLLARILFFHFFHFRFFFYIFFSLEIGMR